VSSDELTLDSIEAELDGITQSVKNMDSSKTEQGDLAMGRLFRAVQKFNYLSQTSSPARPLDAGVQPPPGILDEFDKWVQKFKQALSEIATFLGAAQYTIGVQFPFTISVSITFVPEPN
jgi:hypothetical protein